MRDRILNFSIVVLALTSVSVTTLVVRRELRSTNRVAAPEQIVRVPNYQRLGVGGISLGDSAAPVTVVAFSDFQCPFCKQFSMSWLALRKKYPHDVRMVFHHFPLSSIHPFAQEAALLGECANSLGMFAQMERVLFANQDSIGVAEWTWFASKAGARDTAWVRQCVQDSMFVDRVRRDRELGETLPVEGTPTVLVDGMKIPGTPSWPLLDSLVSTELKRKGRLASLK